jgi:hypothetical protein
MTTMMAHDEATFRTPAAVLTRGDQHREILHRAIATGARRAVHLFEALERDAPKDAIVRATALAFAATEGRLHVGFGDDRYSLSSFALGQVAERAGVPHPYLAGLLSDAGDAPWRAELARDVLQRHYDHDSGRMLVRSVSGQIRGWLSDRFRRLDSRPLVDALTQEATALGAVPVDGVVTETRVALKILLPEILEPVPGEYVVLGAEWSNSDFGNGTHSLRAFLLRVACLNGAVTENALRQVHLGARLHEDLDLSDRTYRLDTATNASALRDVVRNTLSAKGRDRLLAQIRQAHETEYTGAQLATATRRLPKATAWRASNAISWIARATEDPEVRLDLERLAGGLL